MNYSYAIEILHRELVNQMADKVSEEMVKSALDHPEHLTEEQVKEAKVVEFMQKMFSSPASDLGRKGFELAEAIAILKEHK